jgi:hypothetical protein
MTPPQFGKPETWLQRLERRQQLIARARRLSSRYFWAAVVLGVVDLLWNVAIWGSNPVENLLIFTAGFCLIRSTGHLHWARGYEAAFMRMHADSEVERLGRAE